MQLLDDRAAPVKARWTMAALAAATLFGLGAALPFPASAQADDMPRIASEREDVVDPPGRAGRLAEVSGSAWLFHPESGEWMAAERNRPLTSGDRLSTDAGARLELRIGSTTLRLDGASELELVTLDDKRIDLFLNSGSLAIRVRNDEALRELSVTTDDGRFSAQRTGHYRIDRHDGISQLTVWSGQALYEGPASALTVNNGQRADFWIDADRRAQYSLGQPRSDGFAGWAGDMDRADDRAVASRYVSPEMTGAEELDRYGRWEQDPEYGALWTPRDVPAGWAPYATGNWAWVSPWGWTWVDAAPWGFAPFHYGRWVYARNTWCWTPGRYVARPVYAPALVGWVGGAGGSLSVSIGGGPGVGWFPLAPREAYLPRYRVSPRYVRTVNGPHYRNGAEIEQLIRNPSTVLRGMEYRNRKFHHGTTAVPIEAFQRRGSIPVSPQWRGSPVTRDFDRMPATPLGVIAPPPWLGARRDGDRDIGRDGRPDPGRDWRRDGRDGRDGGPRNGVVGGIAAPVVPAAPPREGNGDRPPFDRAGGDWPSGRSRPALPPGTLADDRPPLARQPAAPPPVMAQPGPFQQPAARIEAPGPDPRFNRPVRPERGFDRSNERVVQERPAPQPPRPQAQPQPEAPRMVAPPPRAAMPAPPAPAAAPQARPPEPVRAAPPPSYTGPLQSRDPREAGDRQRDPRGEGNRGGRPQ